MDLMSKFGPYAVIGMAATSAYITQAEHAACVGLIILVAFKLIREDRA